MTPTDLQPSQPPRALAAVGNIQVTEQWLYTPAGPWPLKDVNVSAIDQTRQEQKIPAWAIVMTILTVWFFLLGFLFLLAKTSVVSGHVAVTITNMDGRQHVEYVRVGSESQRLAVFAQVAYVQQLVNHARWVEGQRGT